MKEICRIEGTRLVRSTESTDEDKARLKEMLKARKCASLRGTDSWFQTGWAHDDGLNGSPVRNRYYEEAKKAGISTAGKRYRHDLANYTFDPNGWVGSIGEVYDKCRAQNRQITMGGTEEVLLRNSEGPPQEAIRLDDDLVQEAMNDELRKDPSQAANMPELREKVIDKHGAKKKRITFNNVVSK